MKQNRNSKKSAGRPAGSKTRHPGIKAFALAHSLSHQFVRKVLDGEATSRPVLQKWRQWRERRHAGISPARCLAGRSA